MAEAGAPRGVRSLGASGQGRPQAPATGQTPAERPTCECGGAACGMRRADIACMLQPPVGSVLELYPNSPTCRDGAELCFLGIPAHCIPYRLRPLTTDPVLLDCVRVVELAPHPSRVCPLDAGAGRRCTPYPGTVIGQVDLDVSIWCVCPCMLECARACARMRASMRACVRARVRVRACDHGRVRACVRA